MSIDKKKILLKLLPRNSLIVHKCGCHSRGQTNRISNLHERALKVYQGKKLDFETFLKNEVCYDPRKKRRLSYH